MTDETSTVFVVDDDPAFCKSMKFLISTVGIEVATFHSAAEFEESITREDAGCIILDIRMAGLSGLDLQKRLQEQKIFLPVIILTAYGDVPIAVRAMKNGALDFLEKPVSDQILLDSIQRAIAKDSRLRAQRAKSHEVEQRRELLTNRELEVMELVVEGLSSKAIAGKLGVSFKTVEAHRAKIMKKMEADSVPHLIHLYLACGQGEPVVNGV